jgi:hypothetical protein
VNGGPPEPAPVGEVPFTLRPVTTVARLRQLGRTMHNCLASYGDRLGGDHRIVEVRQGRTVRYAVHIEAGRIVTFEAPGNRPPEPRDVPVVRRLLEREGHLAATLAWGSDGRPGPTAPPVPAGQLTLPTPTSVRDPGSARADRSPAARAGSSTATGARVTTPARPPARRRPAAPTPAPPPGVSLQQLATEHLEPATLQGPDWTEVAAALWAAGLLPRLPSPTETTFVRIVRDLAARVAIGDDAGLPRRTPPTRQDRETARRHLLDEVADGEGWQRRRMAAVLERPLRP